MDLQRLCRQISCSESRRSKAGKQPSPVVPEILLLVQGRRPPGPWAVRNGTWPDTDVWLCPTLQNRQHKTGGKSKDLVVPMRDSARRCAQCVVRDARRASPWRETTHRDCPILAGQLSVSRPILSTVTHQYVGRTQDATPSKLAGREGGGEEAIAARRSLVERRGVWEALCDSRRVSDSRRMRCGHCLSAMVLLYYTLL